MNKFLFDKKVAEDNLKFAVESGYTLIEFTVVLGNEGRWKPYTRIVPQGARVPNYCTVVLDSAESGAVKTQTRAMNTSDFYAEVIDAAWSQKVA